MSNFKKVFACAALIALTSSFSFASQKTRLCKVGRVLTSSSEVDSMPEFGVYAYHYMNQWFYLADNGSFSNEKAANESLKYLVKIGACEVYEP